MDLDKIIQVLSNPMTPVPVKEGLVIVGDTLMKAVQNDLVKPGDVILFNPAAFEAETYLPEINAISPQDPYTFDFDEISYKVRMEFRMGMALAARDVARARVRDLRFKFAPYVSWETGTR